MNGSTVIMKCIYCETELTAATHRAHIWPASIGGRLASRSICCDDCNNATSPAENVLRSALSRAYASVGATNDEREPFGASIDFQGYEFRLENGLADLQVGGSRFDSVTRSMIVPLPAGLDDQAEKMARVMWSQGLGPEDVDKLEIVSGDPGPTLPEGLTRTEYDLSVGRAIEHRRTFVKMALELLAFHRHDLATRVELSEARQFARHGTGAFQGRPDIRSRGSELIPTEGLPEVYNAVEIWSFGRAVFFRVIFLGPISLTGTLTMRWLGSPFRAAYAFDARDPARVIVSRFTECEGPNLTEWSDDVQREAVSYMTSAMESISFRAAQSRIRPHREAPPKIEDFRAAVRALLLARPPRMKRR